MTRESRADAREKLAVLDLLGFFVVCLLIIGLVWCDKTISAVSAGLLGALLGYWAANVQQSRGFYFGASKDQRPALRPDDKLVAPPQARDGDGGTSP